MEVGKVHCWVFVDRRGGLVALPALVEGLELEKTGQDLIVLCILSWTSSRAGREAGGSAQAPDDVPSF